MTLEPKHVVLIGCLSIHK